MGLIFSFLSEELSVSNESAMLISVDIISAHIFMIHFNLLFTLFNSLILQELYSHFSFPYAICQYKENSFNISE